MKSERSAAVISHLLEWWYSTAWRYTYSGVDREIVHDLVGVVANIQEGDHVLEVGSNLPSWTAYSHRVGLTGSFYALDISLPIQKSANRIIQKQNVLLNSDSAQPLLLAGDAATLPFRTDSLDMVIANNYTGDSWGMLTEAKRVLKVGGRIILASTNESSTRTNLKILKELCLSVTFAKLDSSTNHPVWIYTATKN